MDIQAATGTTYVQRDTARPTISGKAESEKDKVGSVAQFWVGGQFYSVPIDPVTGSYTWTAPADIPDGNYSVSITVKDRAGNVGQPLLFTLQIDTTPPEAPELVNLFDDQGPLTGSFDAGKTIDDRRPTLTGLAQKGTTVYLKDTSGNIIGSARADSVTGKWVMEPTQDLKDGVNNLTLIAEETFAGKVRSGAASAPFTIVIADDATAPIEPTITDAYDDFGRYTGSLKSYDITNDNTPTLRGTATANSVVMINVVMINGVDQPVQNIYSVTAGPDGKWSWTPNTALADGRCIFSVKDAASDNWEKTFTLNIDKEFSGLKKINTFENVRLGDSWRMSGADNNSNIQVAIQSDASAFSVIRTPYGGSGGSNDWKDQCIEFLDPATITAEIAFDKVGLSNALSSFGGELWNSGRENAEFCISASTKNASSQTKYFTLKPGEYLSLDSANYFDAIHPYYNKFSLTLLKGGQKVYLDNLFTVEEDTRTSLMLTDEPESVVHFLDGIDELNEHAIIGNETQIDTIQLTGEDQLLDLTQHKAEIKSVEIFDIHGSGDNTLKIDLNVLLHYGEKDLFIEDGKTQLMVNGNAGDVVQLQDILPAGSDISEWQHQQGTVTVAGVEYEVYSHGDDAELLVQQGVKTELI